MRLRLEEAAAQVCSRRSARRASIQRRPTSKGTAYIVRWRYNGLSKSKSFSRLAEAREYDAAMQHSLHVQTYVDPRAGKTTLADFAEVWLGSHAVSAATKAKYRSLLNAQINPALGSLPLDQVTPLRIRQVAYPFHCRVSASSVDLVETRRRPPGPVLWRLGEAGGS